MVTQNAELGCVICGSDMEPDGCTNPFCERWRFAKPFDQAVASWWGWCDDCQCHIDNPIHALAHTARSEP